MNEFFDYWQLLLIPVFFGLGWAAARVDMRQVVLSPVLFRGHIFKA